MSDDADYVLMDSSPILLIPDNLYIAAAADGIILVVSVGRLPSRPPADEGDPGACRDPHCRSGPEPYALKQLNSYYKQYSGTYSA